MNSLFEKRSFFSVLYNRFKKTTIWYRSLVFLSFILLCAVIYNKYVPKAEGFQQKEKFIEKQNMDLFDGFYVAIYDSLFKRNIQNAFEMKTLIYKTGLNKKTSLLDIGCGTGDNVGTLTDKGYRVEGIDQSEAMIKMAQEKYPKAKFSVKNAMTAISFSPESFTHISCLHFTIYYMKDKLTFFNNCYRWLRPGGYLMIHLVNRKMFSPIVPASNPLVMVSPQKYAKKRITNSYVKFTDCEYKADFDLQENKDLAIFKEKIKNDSDGHVRQNTHTLYMPTQKTVLKLAKDAGFIMHAKVDMVISGPEYQYLYILKKPN